MTPVRGRVTVSGVRLSGYGKNPRSSPFNDKPLMASKKLNAANTAKIEDMGIDMSPMIDMVFLLLIFFMVASTMIVDRKDPHVTIPVTPDGRDPQMGVRKVTINVYSQNALDTIPELAGRTSPFADVNGEEITTADISRIMREAKEQAASQNRPVVLYVRGDKQALVLQMKQVLKAAGAGGVQDVIFSGYSR